jgi:hypothetical protein
LVCRIRLVAKLRGPSFLSGPGERRIFQFGLACPCFADVPKPNQEIGAEIMGVGHVCKIGAYWDSDVGCRSKLARMTKTQLTTEEFP